MLVAATTSRSLPPGVQVALDAVVTQTRMANASLVSTPRRPSVGPVTGPRLKARAAVLPYVGGTAGRRFA